MMSRPRSLASSPALHLPLLQFLPLLATALAGCPAQDSNLGVEPDGGSAAATCVQGGKTYQAGQTVSSSACNTCVCLADGQIECTGLCPADAGVGHDSNVTCQESGVTYQVGQTVILSACTTCMCQADGTIGLCTGLCPPDASAKTDATPVTCQQNGTTYQVGQTVTLSACTTCVCQADGTIGLCTGACPPDGGIDGSGDLGTLCTSTGGQVTSQSCCGGVTDFPNLCAIGACGCAPASSHVVSACSCPNGGCFDPSRGCTN
ncbi:MAG: hypothetical protein ABSB49_20295 [Polyangia bacterium]